MTQSLLPLIMLVFVGLFTPGPNVIMMTASGARFGFKRTVPHMLGVAVGTGILAACAGFGVGTALEAAPNLKLSGQILAACWILYLAYKTALAGQHKDPSESDRPFRFIEAVLFQWINPKIWAVSLAASAAYPSASGPLVDGIRLFFVFSGNNLVVSCFWIATGALLAGLLSDSTKWHWFMRIMAVFMALSAIMIFI